MGFAVGELALTLESPDSDLLVAGGAFGVIYVVWEVGCLALCGFHLLFVRLTIVCVGCFEALLLLRFVASRTETVELWIRVELAAILAQGLLLWHLVFLGPRIHY